MDNSPVFAAVLALTVANGTGYSQQPHPVVLVSSFDMPKQVLPEENPLDIVKQEAISTKAYHELREEFTLSHSEFSRWLGVKRRTLYNWLNAPEKSTKLGYEIERRLANLLILKEDMEQEHYRYLHKVAFSPIFGNPGFGEAILSGESSDAMKLWYGELFSNFEALRKNSINSLMNS